MLAYYRPPRPGMEQFAGHTTWRWGKSVLEKVDFMRTSRRRVNRDRKTIAVCHRHEIRTFAPLAGTDARLRAAIVRGAPDNRTDHTHEPRPAYELAHLLKRVFDIDLEHCAHCRL